MKRLSTIALLLLVSIGLAGCGLSAAEEKYNAGTDKFRSKDMDGALADFNEAIRLDPNLALAYMNRGAIYLGNEDYGKAVEDTTKAIDLNLEKAEDRAVAYTNRSIAYLSLKDFEKGLADAEEAVKLQPERAKSYLARGLAHFSLDQNDRAIENFKRVVELAKDTEEGKAAEMYLGMLGGE